MPDITGPIGFEWFDLFLVFWSYYSGVNKCLESREQKKNVFVPFAAFFARQLSSNYFPTWVRTPSSLLIHSCVNKLCFKNHFEEKRSIPLYLVFWIMCLLLTTSDPKAGRVDKVAAQLRSYENEKFEGRRVLSTNETTVHETSGVLEARDDGRWNWVIESHQFYITVTSLCIDADNFILSHISMYRC